MKYLKSITILVATFFGVTGCVSLSDIISKSKVGNFVYQADTPQYVDIEDMLNDSVKEIGNRFSSLQRNIFTDSEFSVKPTKTADAYIVDISWESKAKALFPPGVYDMNHTSFREYNSRQPLIFTKEIIENVIPITRRLDSLGYSEYELKAYYHGTADGLKMTKRGVIYAGEFGDEVQLKSTKTSLNGKNQSIKIQKGQRVSNSELAALRAYGLMQFVEDLANHKEIIDHNYVLSVSDKKGAEHRMIKLVLEIKRKDMTKIG